MSSSRDDTLPEDLLYKDDEERLAELKKEGHLGTGARHQGFRSSWTDLSYKRHKETELDAALHARLEAHIDKKGRTDHILTLDELDRVDPVNIRDVEQDLTSKEHKDATRVKIEHKQENYPPEQQASARRAFEESKTAALSEMTLMERELEGEGFDIDRQELQNEKKMVDDPSFQKFFEEEYHSVLSENAHLSAIARMTEFETRGEAWGRAATRYDEVAGGSKVSIKEVDKDNPEDAPKKHKKPRYFRRNR